MERIFIIGVSPFAEMLRFYIEGLCEDFTFGGFVVDEKYLPDDSKRNKDTPILTFEEFFKTVSPNECKLLSSVTYNKMNTLRQEMFYRLKNRGYKFANYIHPSAVVSSNCDIGEGNIILEGVVIQPFVKIGNNNVFWSHSCICHHTVIGDFNFFAASSIVLGKVVVRDRCFVGCNATIRNRVVVESDTLIGAAAYLTSDSCPETVIVPAKSVILDKKPSDMKI